MSGDFALTSQTPVYEAINQKIVYQWLLTVPFGYQLNIGFVLQSNAPTVLKVLTALVYHIHVIAHEPKILDVCCKSGDVQVNRYNLCKNMVFRLKLLKSHSAFRCIVASKVRCRARCLVAAHSTVLAQLLPSMSRISKQWWSWNKTLMTAFPYSTQTSQQSVSVT